MSSFERFEFLGQAGVQKAIEESRRLGVPNVFSIDGVLHWELPNGELTTEDPYLKQQEKNQVEGTTEDAKGRREITKGPLSPSPQLWMASQRSNTEDF